MDLAGLSKALKRREVSAVEVTRAFLERISLLDPKLRVFLTVAAKEALQAAEEADLRLARAEGVTPLTGIPVAISDNICSKGIKTTCSSKILEGYIPPYDATVVSRLKKAGAVIIGKTNLDEFGIGSSTEHSGFYPTQNPWDPKRVPGGSGAAAALAAGMAQLALASESRLSASFCGVVGLKPTYGRISRYGLAACASSLDRIGLLTKRVADQAPLFQTVAGNDRLDSTSLPDQVKEDYQIPTQIRGVRIGVPEEYLQAPLDRRIKEKVTAAVEVLEKMGCVLREVSLSAAEYATTAYYIISSVEVGSNLARFDGVRYGWRSPRGQDVREMFSQTRSAGLGAEAKRRIIIGNLLLGDERGADYYLLAQKIRTLLRHDFERAFSLCDLILTPTAPTLPFKFGEKTDDSFSLCLTGLYTIPATLAGLPALSLPGGVVDGLPVGVQLIGPALSESLLLRVGAQLEKSVI